MQNQLPHNVRPPATIAKLVQITPITMVYGTQITIVTGANLNQLTSLGGLTLYITDSTINQQKPGSIDYELRFSLVQSLEIPLKQGSFLVKRGSRHFFKSPVLLVKLCEIPSACCLCLVLYVLHPYHHFHPTNQDINQVYLYINPTVFCFFFHPSNLTCVVFVLRFLTFLSIHCVNDFCCFFPCVFLWLTIHLFHIPYFPLFPIR